MMESSTRPNNVQFEGKAAPAFKVPFASDQLAIVGVKIGRIPSNEILLWLLVTTLSPIART